MGRFEPGNDGGAEFATVEESDPGGPGVSEDRMALAACISTVADVCWKFGGIINLGSERTERYVFRDSEYYTSTSTR